jgi:hypothetical protein
VYYEEEPSRPGVLGHGNKTFYASFIRYAMGDGPMSEQVERYRLNAEKCLEVAQTFNDLEVKRTMLGMADAWLTLAAQHVRNVETVDDPGGGRYPHVTQSRLGSFRSCV